MSDLEPSCSSSHTGRTKFSASNGWLAGFLQRHALHSLKIKGEAAFADETAAKNDSKVLANITQDGGYCLDQEPNADKTGLFCKKMPRRTFIAKSENTASGFQAANCRVTLSLHPRALKGNNVAVKCKTVSDGQDEPDYITADKIYAGLQLCHKLECYFLAIDANSERTSKFQKELQTCTSGYRDLYKRLVKQQSSQKLITDYMVTAKKSNLNECVVVSSSDEGDFEPVYPKVVLVLSDYED